jgi:hypothetical protein
MPDKEEIAKICLAHMTPGRHKAGVFAEADGLPAK